MYQEHGWAWDQQITRNGWHDTRRGFSELQKKHLKFNLEKTSMIKNYLKNLMIAKKKLRGRVAFHQDLPNTSLIQTQVTQVLKYHWFLRPRRRPSRNGTLWRRLLPPRPLANQQWKAPRWKPKKLVRQETSKLLGTSASKWLWHHFKAVVFVGGLQSGPVPWASWSCQEDLPINAIFKRESYRA